MSGTYSAILRGDRLEWTGAEPPRSEPPRPVKVTITLPDRVETVDDRSAEPPISEENKRRGIEALRRLAATGAFDQITDVVEWQRDIRKDRPLFGLDDE